MFQREDWELFCSLNTLGQKAGVPANKIAALVAKELADNALDAGFKVTAEERDDGWVVVTDDGPGLPNSPGGLDAVVASLFSVRRPLTSGKLRRPSRGALGNGLRVVTGAVLATGGELVVETRGTRFVLQPEDDGGTSIVSTGPSNVQGTRVSVRLGPSGRMRGSCLGWANMAIAIGPQYYRGPTSCWWYDSDSFASLVRSAGDMPLRDLLREFDNFHRPSKLKQLDVEGLCSGRSREQTDRLLNAMRAAARKIKPRALVSKESAGHVRVEGELEVRPGRPGHAAHLPYVIDVFAYEAESDSASIMVNGTPVTGEVDMWRNGKTSIVIHGAGLWHTVDKVSRATCNLVVNITIPYMPITTDGKEPDLRRLLEPLQGAIRKAMRRLKVEKQRAERCASKKDVVVDHIEKCMREGTCDGELPLSLRQLYYLIRPHALEAGQDLEYGHFCRVITQYEARHGEICGLYRDPRGTLIHPHTREVTQLGTLAVRDYERPRWLIRNVLYCEKEGLFPLLLAAKWPEINDCALLSSKGMATRAARDVIDLLGDGDETLRFFCIHDADASGGLIYQTLQEETLARPGRRVQIVNLGLEPWEAVDLGLQVERFERKNKDRELATAQYVKDRSSWEDWHEWLQSQRVELNAMDPQSFLRWLDEKFAPHRSDKLVPPSHVLRDEARRVVRARKEAELLARLKRDNRFDELLEREAEDAFAALDVRASRVQRALQDAPEKHWAQVVRETVEDVT